MVVGGCYKGGGGCYMGGGLCYMSRRQLWLLQ
jgi:hypothetical protein